MAHKYSVAYIVRTASLLDSIDLLIDRHTAAVRLDVKSTNSTANDLSDTIRWNLAIDLREYKESYVLHTEIPIIEEFLKNCTNLIISPMNTSLQCCIFIIFCSCLDSSRKTI